MLNEKMQAAVMQSLSDRKVKAHSKLLRDPRHSRFFEDSIKVTMPSAIATEKKEKISLFFAHVKCRVNKI